MTHQEYLDWCKDISERMKKVDFLYEYHFTNADRIRIMTDDELAKWLNDMQGYSFNCGLLEARISEYPNRYKAWLEWLKEEAGET